MTAAPSLAACLAANPAALGRGPLALILCEDHAALTETLHHHLKLGFAHILALSPEPLALPECLAARVTNAIWDTRQPAAHVGAVNALNDAVPPGTWIYYGFNAEFLFFPFCESRSIAEMLAFHAEERRDAMLTYVLDLYPGDLDRAQDGVALDAAMLDRAGYYALGRRSPDGQKFAERQMDVFGGLRWRFDEHLPQTSRRIDRIGLFRAAKGLRISPDHRMNITEYNTISCGWHHNLTAGIASFRIAKALMRNPASRARINGFTSPGSVEFGWNSVQLMELGLIEPGQWF